MEKTKIRLSKEEKKFQTDFEKRINKEIIRKKSFTKRAIELRIAAIKQQEKMYRKVFDEVNVDYDSIMKEIERRHVIQSKKSTKTLQKLTRDLLPDIKSEFKSQKKITNAYLKKYRKDLEKLQGNPILKLSSVRPGDRGAFGTRRIVTPADEGILFAGTSRTDFPEWDIIEHLSPHSSLSRSGDKHFFLPEMWINNRDFDHSLHIEIIQFISLTRGPLAAGRGNFNVSSIKVNLFGMGSLSVSEAGPDCPFCLDSTGSDGKGVVSMDLEVFQTTPIPMTMKLIDNHILFRGSGLIEPIEINLLATSFGRTFLLASPDNGGDEITARITLRFKLGTRAEKHAMSIMSFNYEETGGIELGCIELHGEYLG